MLQFETLLLRQLQKQQNRDEFCDTVLQTQGVSVPVHSCVLSAFSPRLYGTLSSMPVPMTGQRRLIELQAVDACTLLSLVSLLYSGQLHENREQVLSAAQTLGIEVPQWQEEERHGGKVGRRKDPDQEVEKEVDAREWDDRMTRRMEEGSGGEKEKIRESSTQTECGRETDERSAQTDLACSEHQSIQTVCLIDQSTCSTNQELLGYMDIHDPALALQNDPPHSRRPRGCPRLRPLLPASRSFSSMMPTELGTVDTTELDLLHTVTPTPAAQMEPVQSIDTFLDDLVTGLHFLPPEDNQTNQQDLTSSTTSSDPPILKAMYPNSHSVKPTDPKQHLEGELCDILDHFLMTFEQQVGCCGLDLGDETLTNQSSDKSDPSTDPWKNTPKTYSQLQPHNPHLHHQKPQANFLYTSSTLSTQPQFTPMVNPSVAENTNGRDGQIHAAEVQKPSTDQNIMQQFENRRLTRSQKRKLETALISLQTPVKTKGIEKQGADTKKKGQRDDLGQSEACVNKSGVNNLDKNNKYSATKACSKERQAGARQKRQEVNRLGRRKRSVENRSHRMDGFYESKKSPQKGRPTIHGGGKRKKNVGEDHEETKHISNGYQACQSSVKSQIGGNCIEIASSAMEKVRMLLQLQSEEEDVSANESVGIYEENKVGNGRLVNHKERLPVENSLQGHLGEMQKPADEGRIAVNGDGQARRSSVVEASQRHEDEERMANGLRPFRLNLPSNAGTMHKMADLTLDIGYAPGLTSTARLSHTQACQELLGPHTSTKDLLQLAGSSVDEDEDVDVLEVSSLNSALPAVSTVILGVDLSTEEEEEDDVEEDVEIDVLGLEPD